MRILHINSYYIDNHLYSYLYKELDSLYNQRIYVPIKWNREPENLVNLKQGQLHFSKVLRKKHKFLFGNKIETLYKDLVGQNLHKETNLVHAHNLFNDGAVAYRLFRRFAIPYSVAVRSTDINLQYKYMIHRRSYIQKVLLAAENVIFISEVSKAKFFGMLPVDLVRTIEIKTQIIPNGIDEFWHENTYIKSQAEIDNSSPFRLIYVGQIIKRKKLELSLKALEELNRGGQRFELIVIGGSNKSEMEYFNEMCSKFEKRKDIYYLGKIKDKNELLKQYRQADAFLMVSLNELFGLVYAEALTQGLPLIYHRSAGIHSFIENLGVGRALNDYSVEQLKDAIIELSEKYKDYIIDPIAYRPFNWKVIVEKYKQLYTEMLN